MKVTYTTVSAHEGLQSRIAPRLLRSDISTSQTATSQADPWYELVAVSPAPPAQRQVSREKTGWDVDERRDFHRRPVPRNLR